MAKKIDKKIRVFLRKTLTEGPAIHENGWLEYTIKSRKETEIEWFLAFPDDVEGEC